ncbi:hypothetical protein TGMAS_415700 [Toxoplasma gondii MAS]|uniref:Uncharacterized protein n=1 Tax=Toxoplasma gondii MAS TaxID=943118 RepID=A0A086Q5Q2_TOXGO|nr:hypothetical protein TGMAS_415700 [Toxoplasma gondii MAS]
MSAFLSGQCFPHFFLLMKEERGHLQLKTTPSRLLWGELVASADGMRCRRDSARLVRSTPRTEGRERWKLLARFSAGFSPLAFVLEEQMPAEVARKDIFFARLKRHI